MCVVVIGISSKRVGKRFPELRCVQASGRLL
jgi:hypothetical protein